MLSFLGLEWRTCTTEVTEFQNLCDLYIYINKHVLHAHLFHTHNHTHIHTHTHTHKHTHTCTHNIFFTLVVSNTITVPSKSPDGGLTSVSWLKKSVQHLRNGKHASFMYVFIWCTDGGLLVSCLKWIIHWWELFYC